MSQNNVLVGVPSADESIHHGPVRWIKLRHGVSEVVEHFFAFGLPHGVAFSDHLSKLVSDQERIDRLDVLRRANFFEAVSDVRRCINRFGFFAVVHAAHVSSQGGEA